MRCLHCQSSLDLLMFPSMVDETAVVVVVVASLVRITKQMQVVLTRQHQSIWNRCLSAFTTRVNLRTLEVMFVSLDLNQNPGYSSMSDMTAHNRIVNANGQSRNVAQAAPIIGSDIALRLSNS